MTDRLSACQLQWISEAADMNDGVMLHPSDAARLVAEVRESRATLARVRSTLSLDDPHPYAAIVKAQAILDGNA